MFNQYLAERIRVRREQEKAAAQKEAAKISALKPEPKKPKRLDSAGDPIDFVIEKELTPDDVAIKRQQSKFAHKLCSSLKLPLSSGGNSPFVMICLQRRTVRWVSPTGTGLPPLCKKCR